MPHPPIAPCRRHALPIARAPSALEEITLSSAHEEGARAIRLEVAGVRRSMLPRPGRGQCHRHTLRTARAPSEAPGRSEALVEHR
jgi:hypothetical protein